MQLEKIVRLKNYKILPVACSLGNTSFEYSGPLLFLNYLKHQHPLFFKACSDLIDHSSDIVDLDAQIFDFNTELAQEITKVLENDQVPIILGGDHSIAMGTWSALTLYYQAEKNFGLIWIDAHLDLHTVDTSPSGNVHGMPMGYLLGLGEHEFKKILSERTKFAPEHIVFIGIRDYEDQEWERIQALGIKVYKVDEVHKRGVREVFSEAYDYLSSKVDVMGISLDLDVFDPSYTDDVATPVPNGLCPDDMYETLQQYSGDEKIKALEIVEFTPKENYMKTNKIIYNLMNHFIPS